MASSSTCFSYSSVPETVLEGLEFSEANNLLLMALMEETQEDDLDDDRLMTMIQSLEAEISNQRYDHHVGQVDGQDCSMSSSFCTTDDWMDVEVASAFSSSSPPFDEDMKMSAWSPCAAGGDDSCSHGIWLDNYYYLPQEASDVAF
ncbi:hypothetical protein QN277_008930 [Acacia crassicarpa]|uniref:Uncharacterized protein n=1 Tax=Acacia crassicarpa TaxID=499986 RepID=A0AAE1JMV0_9FABA|nr:hypothetical protein QN277_008930 [Acacia crassicarpa]